MQILAKARAVGREALGVDALRHALDRQADSRREMLRRPAVADERVGLREISAIARVRFAGHVDDDGRVVDAQPRRLIQRVRVDDVGLPLTRGDPPPRRAAEPFLVGVQDGRRQTAEPAAALTPVDEVAHVRRSQQRHVRLVEHEAGSAEEQRASGDDVDVGAERGELARPGEMPRLAAAPHHREAPHEHRHAHACSRVPARSTCARAQSSRQTSVQIRFA